MRILLLYAVLGWVTLLHSSEPFPVWPDRAPGETSHATGEIQPFRPEENPPVTRVTKIRRPTFTVHVPKEANGTGVVILPGGGFGKVVPDKEGTEAAAWLARHGVTSFVLSYRTTFSKTEPGWVRPLQDAQRLLSLIRAKADKWRLNPDRIGLLGFSAGGNVAARLLSSASLRSYDLVDAVDKVSFRPDFAMLVYPWRIYDAETDGLVEGASVPASCPPTFIVHTDDDRSSSLGAVLFYTGLKRQRIPAELHVYGNGGHGYGLRPVKNSEISSWPGHAGHWLDRWIAEKNSAK